MDAWTNTFYIQNDRFKHSWFIHFKKNQLSNYPSSFLNGKQILAQSKKFLPQPLKMAYKNIEEIHQPIAQLSFFHSLFHLYAKHLITKESSYKILAIRLKIK